MVTRLLLLESKLSHQYNYGLGIPNHLLPLIYFKQREKQGPLCSLLGQGSKPPAGIDCRAPEMGSGRNSVGISGR